MSKFILSSSEPGSELNKFRILDVRADDTDARDYIFQPSLTLLPEIFDNRRYSVKVLDQQTEGACVGFTLAAVINISLKKREGEASKRDKKILNLAENFQKNIWPVPVCFMRWHSVMMNGKEKTIKVRALEAP